MRDGGPFAGCPPRDRLRPRGALFEQYHYTGRTFDDELSERSLENYLDALDYSHLIFLQADVDAFRAKYSDRLDDLNDDPMGLVAAAFEIYELYRTRMRSRRASSASLMARST